MRRSTQSLGSRTSHMTKTASDGCAYCGAPGPYTKDHVWPKSFLDRTGRQAAHFSHQSRRAHGADYVVADVCEQCNNVALNYLDAYFCQLYDKYFATAHGHDTTIRFTFDYHLLTRALLKIAYNSARSAGSDDTYLRTLAPYIRSGPPAQSQVAVFAELVSPTAVKDPAVPGSARYQLPTNFYRSAITKILTPAGERIHTRIVAVGSYYFHLIFPAQAMSDEDFASAARELGERIEGTVRLTPGETEVLLRSSPQDAITSIVKHLRQHKETYAAFFRRRHT